MTADIRKLVRSAAAASLLISCLTLLPGCWNSKDIQNLAYVTAIGLDYEDGRYTTYVQVLNFSNIARSEGVQLGKKVPTWVGKGEGKTIVGSLDALYATSQLQLFWGHVKTVVLTEGLMRKGFVEAYNALNRYREIRYNVLIYGTKERMTDIFTQKSLLNMSPLDTLMYTPQATYSQRSFIAPIQGHKAIARMNEPAQPLMVPSLSITKEVWNEDQKHVPMFTISGAYFFNEKRLSGWLSNNDLEGARWTQKDMERAFVQVPDTGTPAAILELNKPRYSVRPVITGNKVQYDLKVRLRGKLSELLREESIEKLERMAEQTLHDQIKLTYRKGLAANCDVFKLREQLYRNNPETWKRLKNPPLDEQSLRQIRISVSIVSTGKYKGRAS